MVKKNYYVGQVFKDLYLAATHRYYTVIGVTPERIHVRNNQSNEIIRWWTYRDMEHWLGSDFGLRDISFNKYLEAL